MALQPARIRYGGVLHVQCLGPPSRSLAGAGRGPNVRERGVEKTVKLALREAGFTLFFPTSTLPRNPNR